VTAGWSPGLLQGVERAMAAAVVLLPEGVPVPEALTSTLLAYKPTVVVAPRSFGFTGQPTTLGELSRHPWVLNQDGCGMRSALSRAMSAAGLPFNVAVEAFGSEMQLSLVARGLRACGAGSAGAQSASRVAADRRRGGFSKRPERLACTRRAAWTACSARRLAARCADRQAGRGCTLSAARGPNCITQSAISAPVRGSARAGETGTRLLARERSSVVLGAPFYHGNGRPPEGTTMAGFGRSDR
jgi:DNA-binding transcriptional LysR family regulator